MIFKILSYLRFLKGSKNQHGIHSPFVYSFITLCLYDKKKYSFYEEIKKYQQLLHENKNHKNDLLTYKRAKLLHRITTYFQAKHSVDLSFTDGFIAFSMQSENADLFCLEETEKKLKSTKIFLSNFKAENIKVSTKRFKEVLDQLPQKEKKQFFIGRNINSENIISVFKTLLPYITSDSLVILDGIHLTKEREEIWKQIKNHSKVKVTVDLYFWGIIFFREKQAKQHFKIRI